MAKTERILVLVTDETCSDNECIEHRVMPDVSYGAVMEAVEILYPTCREVTVSTIEVEGKEDI